MPICAELTGQYDHCELAQPSRRLEGQFRNSKLIRPVIVSTSRALRLRVDAAS